MHAVLNRKGNFPTVIPKTAGKYQDVKTLDKIESVPDEIYNCKPIAS